ncbi:MAG: RNA-directed DNA polymerase [Bacteroidota bacterium]
MCLGTYYDFNYNIEERSQTIRNEILSGSYRASKPIIFRLEKKFGVCRHLTIPQPSDALVLQVLTEALSVKVLKKQPSRNAFYSRDRHNMRHLHEIDEYGLDVKTQWKKMQRSIYNFSESKELLVVTDLSNYYDSIDLIELRSIVAQLSEANEVVIDLLFSIIEEISWRPDYLPYRARGLPTSNLEAIRLLAHSFLFELDELIRKKSDNCFARWMDDITIGVNSKREAVETISSVSDVLKSRSLAINLSKTDIYDHEKANFNFLIEINRELDKFQDPDVYGYYYAGCGADFIRLFNEHLEKRDHRAKYWEKVLKRFITIFATYRSHYLVDFIKDLYIEFPSVRTNLLYYLRKIGYNDKVAVLIIEILDDIALYDDVSLFQICELVTFWEVNINEEFSDNFLQTFEDKILSFSESKVNTTQFHFFCTIWFKTKYSHPEDFYDYIKKFQNLWQRDNFLRRQVTCSLARIYTSSKKEEVKSLLQAQISSGIMNVVSPAAQIVSFAKFKSLDKKLSSYLFYTNEHFPLSKFLVLCSVLNSSDIRNDHKNKEKIIRFVNDPYYLHWLNTQFNIKPLAPITKPF